MLLLLGNTENRKHDFNQGKSTSEVVPSLAGVKKWEFNLSRSSSSLELLFFI